MGLIDKTGQWVLPASYDNFYPPIRSSSEKGLELLGVAKDGKVGYIDAKGNVVIDFQYKATGRGIDYFYSFSEGLALVIVSSEDAHFIDRTGKVLFELPGTPRGFYNEGYMMLFRGKDKRYGLIDQDGKWYSLPSVLDPSPFYGRVSDGVLMVRENKGTLPKNWGYIEIRKSAK